MHGLLPVFLLFLLLCTAGSDFIQITESFSFEVGEQKKCGTVTILEDTVIENAESFQVTIDTFDVANGSAEVIITDNDGRQYSVIVDNNRFHSCYVSWFHIVCKSVAYK